MTEPVIYIPTYQRRNLKTLESMAGSKSLEKVTLVVHPDDKDSYRHYGVRVLACPVQGELGAVRRWLMEHDDCQYQIQMDDDLKFAVRRTDDPGKFLPASPEDIDEMFHRVFTLLREVPLVGVRQRGGANRSKPPFETSVRQCMFHALDVWAARENGWAYKSSVFEDFDYTLQVLTSGYENAVLTTHVIDQSESQAPGGVAAYRDNARMQRDALDLAMDYPDFVRIVAKKGWRGMEFRTDVNVQWKRAFASSASPTRADLSLYEDLWWPTDERELI